MSVDEECRLVHAVSIVYKSNFPAIASIAFEPKHHREFDLLLVHEPIAHERHLNGDIPISELIRNHVCHVFIIIDM